MDSNRIQPVSGNHAIEVMAIGIEWAMPMLEDAQFASFKKVYEENAEIKDFLPTLAPVQSFIFQGINQLSLAGPGGNVQVVPQDASPPQLVPRNGGFDLQRFEPSGKAAWALSIRPEFISISCTVYDRWKNVKPKALGLLRPFVESAMNGGATITAIGLQYQDAFKLRDGASPDASAELFRKDGRILPTHLFEQPLFWHCHQGWFSAASDARRILNNIAIEVADVNGTHFARIGGQHRAHANAMDGTEAMPINAGQIDAILQCLHEENIKVINGVLSDGALKAIGCSVVSK